jgi:hypothetical protein
LALAMSQSLTVQSLLADARVLPSARVGCDRVFSWPVRAKGGELEAWADRLTALPQLQFFLFDRDAASVSAEREALVRALNQQPGRVAYLTSSAARRFLHLGGQRG